MTLQEDIDMDTLAVADERACPTTGELGTEVSVPTERAGEVKYPSRSPPVDDEERDNDVLMSRPSCIAISFSTSIFPKKNNRVESGVSTFTKWTFS